MTRRPHVIEDLPAPRRRMVSIAIEKRLRRPSDLTEMPEAWCDVAADALGQGLVVWLVSEQGINGLLVTNSVRARAVPKLGRTSPEAA